MERQIFPKYYNVSWGNARPKRDIEALEQANIIFLFSSNEFTYHGSDVVNPLFLKEMNRKIEAAKHAFEGKHVVLFSIELYDPPELLRDTTLSGVRFGDWSNIYNHDFPLTLGTIRFNMLARLGSPPPESRPRDFVYWGTTKRQLPGGSKSGDMRYDIVRKVLRDERINSFLVGNHFGSAKADKKWEPSMERLSEELVTARSTACFQWPGLGHILTWRYQEALALGLVPFVHAEFDTGGSVVHNPWLRFSSPDELAKKIMMLRDDTRYLSEFRATRRQYVADAPSDEEQYKLFAKLMKQRAGLK